MNGVQECCILNVHNKDIKLLSKLYSNWIQLRTLQYLTRSEQNKLVHVVLSIVLIFIISIRGRKIQTTCNHIRRRHCINGVCMCV